MAEYIEREALKDIFCDACSTKTRYKRTVEQCRNKIDTDGNKCFKMRLIDQAPTADVVEVRHGEWIYKRGEYSLSCSLCGEIGCKDSSCETPYCPNCSAKMDRKGEGE